MIYNAQPDIQFHSRDWASIKEYLAEVKQELLEMISNPSLSEQDTALARGRILMIREILDLESSPASEIVGHD